MREVEKMRGEGEEREKKEKGEINSRENFRPPPKLSKQRSHDHRVFYQCAAN